MPEEPQEKYLTKTSFKNIIARGLKKLITELTSIKTLFLAFICVAAWYNKITDLWCVIGGLAVLGVKELPTNIFETIVNKFGGERDEEKKDFFISKDGKGGS
jgi:hypothetical protein